MLGENRVAGVDGEHVCQPVAADLAERLEPQAEMPLERDVDDGAAAHAATMPREVGRHVRGAVQKDERLAHTGLRGQHRHASGPHKALDDLGWHRRVDHVGGA